MKVRLLSCLLLSLLSRTILAQQHLVDSILKELSGPMPDSNRAMSMMRLAIDYEMVDTTKSFKAYREAIEYAGKKKLLYQLGRIYQNQSFLFMTTNDPARAKSSLDSAVYFYQRSGHVKAEQYEASAYNGLANVFKQQNDLQLAAEYYLKSIAINEKLGLHVQLANTYGNLSNLFGDMEEEAKQLEYANKALEAAKKSGSGQNIFTSYFMLTNYYNRMLDSKSARQYLDSTRKYFNESENLDNIDIYFSYLLISAQVFKIMGNYDSAYYFFEKSFALSNKYNYSYGRAESQLQLGAVSILQKKYDQAERFILSGINEAKAINYYGMLDEGYKYLSDIYAVTNRYKEAYEYFQLYKDLSDSVVNLESKKYATELEKKYETEKKDKQIRLQQAQLLRRKTLNYILIGSAATLILITVLSYRNYRQRQKLNQQRISQLEKARQLTATEAILKGEEQERSRLAKDLHDGLGGMMSGIKYSLLTMKQNQIMTPENQQAFERSIDMLDSSINEMRRVAHNMMPEALVKFGLDTALNDFCSEVEQTGALQVNYQSMGIKDSAFDQMTSISIYRIVQELINNTMKHAAARSAIVQVSKTNGVVSITVEDDGRGFDTAILGSSKGIGWNNIQSRVEYLKGTMDVRSGPGEGTSVHIELNA